MKKADFLKDMQEMLEADSLYEDAVLLDLDNFDSMTIMELVAYSDANFKKKFTFSDISSINTVAELMTLIGKENFED